MSEHMKSSTERRGSTRVLRAPSQAAAWHPTQQLLAIATGRSKVFMWSPTSCRTAALPIAHELHVTDLMYATRTTSGIQGRAACSCSGHAV